MDIPYFAHVLQATAWISRILDARDDHDQSRMPICTWVWRCWLVNRNLPWIEQPRRGTSGCRSGQAHAPCATATFTRGHRWVNSACQGGYLTAKSKNKSITNKCDISGARSAAHDVKKQPCRCVVRPEGSNLLQHRFDRFHLSMLFQQSTLLSNRTKHSFRVLLGHTHRANTRPLNRPQWPLCDCSDVISAIDRCLWDGTAATRRPEAYRSLNSATLLALLEEQVAIEQDGITQLAKSIPS